MDAKTNEREYTTALNAGDLVQQAQRIRRIRQQDLEEGEAGLRHGILRA